MSMLSRFRILFLRTVRQPVFYVITALALLLQVFLTQAVLPSADNMRIGLYRENGILAGAVADDLLSGRSSYEFTEYQSRAELENAVLSGRVDTGFVLDERLDTIAETGDIKGCVDCISSTSSTKTAPAKEEIFASVLYQAGGDILMKLIKDKGDAAPEGADQEALRRYNELVDSDEVLNIIFLDENGNPYENAGGQNPDEAGRSKAGRSVWIASLVTFAAALFFAGERFRSGSRAVTGGLRPGSRFGFHLTRNLPPVLLLGLAQLILLLVKLKSGGFIVLWILSLLITALWVTVFSLCFRHEPVYIFSILIVVLMCAVLTSDMLYLPTLKVLARIFPPGILKVFL